MAPTLVGLKLLHSELERLSEKPIDGIIISPDEADLFTLSATVIGPGNNNLTSLLLCPPDGSPYKGGKFALRLVFTEEYPRVPPKGIVMIISVVYIYVGHFLTTIFHPNISPNTGEICLSTLQKDWKSNLGLEHLLLTIKSLLLTPNAESALNEDAGKMLLEDYDGFYRKAALLASIHASAPTVLESNQENELDDKKGTIPLKKTHPAPSSLLEARKKLRRL